MEGEWKERVWREVVRNTSARASHKSIAKKSAFFPGHFDSYSTRQKNVNKSTGNGKSTTVVVPLKYRFVTHEVP